ncbi:MAG: hypothetical protein OXT09_35800 [Myxococcales bacterium]|nr:hypothetical protein [Myxococcales bacterium]
MRLLPFLSALSMIALGCGAPPEPAPAPAPEASTGEEAEAVPAGQQMWHHFWDIIKARDAVIGARLGDVNAPMSRIASGEFGMDVPPDWMNWIEDMQAQAKKGASPASLSEAAVAVSTVAGACADCHRTTGGGPKLEGDTRGYKPDGTGLSEAMARHAWAAEELWLGMTAPRHEAWMRGATALASMELPQDEPPLGAEPPAEAAAEGEAAEPPAPAPETSPLWQDLEKMRALGKRAEQAGQPAEKTAVYAEMLAQCAGCHAAAGFE